MSPQDQPGYPVQPNDGANSPQIEHIHASAGSKFPWPETAQTPAGNAMPNQAVNPALPPVNNGQQTAPQLPTAPFTMVTSDPSLPDASTPGGPPDVRFNPQTGVMVNQISADPTPYKPPKVKRSHRKLKRVLLGVLVLMVIYAGRSVFSGLMPGKGSNKPINKIDTTKATGVFSGSDSTSQGQSENPSIAGGESSTAGNNSSTTNNNKVNPYTGWQTGQSIAGFNIKYPANWTYSASADQNPNIGHIVIQNDNFMINIDTYTSSDPATGGISDVKCPDCSLSLGKQPFNAGKLKDVNLELIKYKTSDQIKDALILRLSDGTYYIESPSVSGTRSSFRATSKSKTIQNSSVATSDGFMNSPDFKTAQLILESLAY